MKPKKGTYNGPCNRTACQKPGATWWNRSTFAYYCESCAKKINTANGQWQEQDLCIKK